MATTPQSLRPAAGRPDWLTWSAFPLQSRFAAGQAAKVT
jgi:hypothetical protein